MKDKQPERTPTSQMSIGPEKGVRLMEKVTANTRMVLGVLLAVAIVGNVYQYIDLQAASARCEARIEKRDDKHEGTLKEVQTKYEMCLRDTLFAK